MPNGEQRNLKDVYLSANGRREQFTWPRGGGGEVVLPQRNRLEEALAAAVAAAAEQAAERNLEIAGGQAGFYLEFEGSLEKL